MKICFDRTLPKDRLKPRRSSPGRMVLEAISPVRKQWINGTTLRVRFINGSPHQHAIVKTEAQWWAEYANIKFDFNNAPDAEIRITFNSNDGAWSYVGTDCASIPLDQATMNLGFLDKGTAAHEFGHALGLAHEHQNPSKGIQWNEPRVIEDLSGPPNFWDQDTIRHNVLEKYSSDQVRGTVFDPNSVMLYFFPKEWTLTGLSTAQNSSLSALDKEFIGGAQMYPKPTPTAPEKVFRKLTPNYPSRTSASIGKPGEEDLYVFTVPKKKGGRYVIDTRGNTNVAMRLYGPNSSTALIAEDDDSGVDLNAMISVSLIPGNYYVQIRHSDIANGTGRYSIRVVWKNKI